MTFSVSIPAWQNGGPIPPRFAFGKRGSDGPFAFADNISPAISWHGAPEGTQSYTVMVIDSDVPSSPDLVNREDQVVPADLPRVDFSHWTLVDIPASVLELKEGAGSAGVVPRGKPVGSQASGTTGQNCYTNWFAADSEMAGVYGGYDGPCPPWNDMLLHHYHFQVFALNVTTLGLAGAFTFQQVRSAMAPHILATATWIGSYSMNPNLHK